MAAREPAVVADGRVEVRNVNHPESASTMDARVYAAMREAILAVVPRAEPGALFKELPTAVARVVDPELFADRSVSWYTTTVKLDLEARGLLKRVRGRGPQRLLRTA